MYAASAIAANTVARSACGAAAPLFTDQMFSKLGIGGGGSLIGGAAVILALIPFAFYRYGESIRIKSKFSPTGPKKAPNASDEAEKGRVGGRGAGDVATEGDSSEDTGSSSKDEPHEHRGDRESLDSNPFDYMEGDVSVDHH